MTLNETTIKDCLNKIIDPSTGLKLSDAADILKLAFEDGHIGLVLGFHNTESGHKDTLVHLRNLAEQSLKNLEGVVEASVVASFMIKPAQEKQIPEEQIQAGKSQNLQPGDPSRMPPPPFEPRKPPSPPKPEKLSTVKHVIAISSGKGGVGKSTTALNLAIALQERQSGKAALKVGLLDLDIFGPSLPTLLGTDQKPTAEKGILQPILAHGLTTMSIGYLIDPDHPVVWRGPRVMGATRQMLKEVAWGDLDVLVIDMPPGTGDIPLTMVQQVVLSGAVIISTPQDLALIDARKGLAMFREVGTPIIGLIENMSGYECPSCGTHSAIFGKGGAEEAASVHKTGFLGAIPLTLNIREAADSGTPLLISHPKCKEAERYRIIATKIKDFLNL